MISVSRRLSYPGNTIVLMSMSTLVTQIILLYALYLNPLPKIHGLIFREPFYQGLPATCSYKHNPLAFISLLSSTLSWCQRDPCHRRQILGTTVQQFIVRHHSYYLHQPVKLLPVGLVNLCNCSQLHVDPIVSQIKRK